MFNVKENKNTLSLTNSFIIQIYLYKIPNECFPHLHITMKWQRIHFQISLTKATTKTSFSLTVENWRIKRKVNTNKF